MFSILFPALFVNAVVQAQPLQMGKATVTGSYRYFDIAAGLPQMQITNLTQDGNGFIWVSTKAGIARWDGNSFYHYSYKNTGAKEARGQAIRVIPTGNNSFIALQNYSLLFIKGIQLTKITSLNLFKNTQIVAIFPYTQSSILVTYVYDEDRDSTSYLIYNFKSHTVANRSRIAGHIFSVIDSNTLLISNNIVPKSTLYLQSSNKICDSVSFFQNQLFSITGKPEAFFFNFSKARVDFSKPLNELQRLQVKNKRFVITPYHFRKPVVFARAPSFVYINDSSYYYLDNDMVVHYVSGNKNISYTKVTSTNISLTDSAGNLWMGTEQGMYCFYRNGFQKYNFKFSENDNIWSITRETNGKYYIADYGNGIYEYNDSNKTWKELPVITENTTVDNVWNSLLRLGSMAATRLWNGGVLLPLTTGFIVRKGNFQKLYFPLKMQQKYLERLPILITVVRMLSCIRVLTALMKIIR